MKGTHLGEFEELVMLVVAALFDEAYGVSIKSHIMKHSGRSVSLSSVHSALHRLEAKGYMHSRFGAPTKMRGGKRKKLFRITASGVIALQSARNLRDGLWNSIPPLALQSD